jgi:hypothetical protein
VCLVAQAFSVINVKSGGSPSGAGSSLVADLVESRAGACRALGDAPTLLVVDYC